MNVIVALGAVTVGINLASSQAELHELDLIPGGFTILSVGQMEDLRLALEGKRGTLPAPRSGGSIGNTASLIARAGISCGMMGVGGDDRFGRFFVADCERASLKFLSKLEDDAITGYDFYLYDENGERTIVLTQGANALLSPARIDINAIQSAELFLLDGAALAFGSESVSAMVHCVETAEAAGVPFVLTLASTQIVDGYRAFFDTYAPKAQIVAGNLEQVAVLVSLNQEAALKEVRSELAKTAIDAIVTLDARGVFARFGDDEFFVPTQAIAAVDSTGAGDGFLAAFIVARKMGLSIGKSLAVGNVVSAEVIQYDSARLPMRVDVSGLVQDALQFAATLDD